MSDRRQINSTLVNAWHAEMCQALRFGHMLEKFPGMVLRCLTEGYWEHRLCRDKGRNFESPLEYFTYYEPDGVGTTDEQVRFLLRDHHEALERWREATTGEPGNPTGANQHRSGNHNNIMNSQATQGTSKAYLLKRLKESHKSLFKRTLLPKKLPNGEKNPKYLSPYAAAKKAGIIVPPTPFERTKKLVKKHGNTFTTAQKRQLKEMLE